MAKIAAWGICPMARGLESLPTPCGTRPSRFHACFKKTRDGHRVTEAGAVSVRVLDPAVKSLSDDIPDGQETRIVFGGLPSVQGKKHAAVD